jgi:hypothetical protein
VPEPVDGLELVADREQVVALERFENVELQAIRVLELVHHDHCEALRPAFAQRVMAAQKVADAELEVLEIHGRAVPLGSV